MAEQVPLISYESMLEAGMHFGRKRTVFSPKMGEFVFTVRDGICIIDLLKTQEALVSTIEYLNQTLQAGGLVLWVAPTKQSQDGIRALAELTGMPYVVDRWLGGTLTNFKNLNGRVKTLIQMEDDKAAGRWEKYNKKEQLDLTRTLADMRRKFDGLKKLTRLPDVVVVASLKEGALAVHESKVTGVKVVALANTDADPTGIVRVVPCNDRSKKSVDLILDAIRDNIKMTA
ncbi:MAG TPA: 30S ribosomal protein S2 [Candidatus Paceibacterota bacterium]|nr:30S ribosomal protein S2 [Candidatus Paceibacterota bacterium]